MMWDMFGPVHIVSLVLAAIIIAALYFVLRKCSEKVQTNVLFVLSFWGIAAILWDLIWGDCLLENLPLHLCSVNAMLLPITVKTKNKRLGNLLLLWCLGALIALLLPYDLQEEPVVAWHSFFYFFPHVVEFGIPLLLIWLGHIKKDWRCIGSTMLVTLVIYTGIHFINTAINSYCLAHQVLNAQGNIISVNYIFTQYPNNGLVELFYKVIPVPYWYMFLAFPIILIYLVALYVPQILQERKKQKVV